MSSQIWGDGPVSWELDQDDDGFRTYLIVYRIKADVQDGPATVLTTPGLPLIGSAWAIGNDYDLWVWRRPQTSVRRAPEYEKGEAGRYWEVGMTFSNRIATPGGGGTGGVGGDSGGGYGGGKCQDGQTQDPLLEPPRVSGSFVKYREEAARDKNGRPILNSAHERIRGPQVEFDRSRPTVKIEQNVLDLQLALMSAMQDCVNSVPMWGLPRRCIKFSVPQWSQQFYGTCYPFFTRCLEFDINQETFDRTVMDEGTKFLNGEWNPANLAWTLKNIAGAPPDPNNPRHFIRAIDPYGNPIRAPLNGRGLPADSLTPSGNRFISTGGATGDPGAGGTNWLPFRGHVGAWGLAVAYNQGEVVQFLGDLYLAANNNAASVPSAGGPWVWLPNGVIDTGDWVTGTTYLIGEVATSLATTLQGYRLIQKYAEADFSYLGIPLII